MRLTTSVWLRFRLVATIASLSHMGLTGRGQAQSPVKSQPVPVVEGLNCAPG